VNIIKKAKDLIALRDRAGTPAESAAAARALAALLDKHRISMTELEMSGSEEKEDIVANRSEPIAVWRRAVTWRRNLISVLCQHYGVAHWHQMAVCSQSHSRWGLPLRRNYETSVFLCGRQSDMDIVRYMFAWLSADVTRIGKSYCVGRGRRFSHSWMIGFVGGIEEQLTEARRTTLEMKPEETGICLQGRFQEAMEFMRNKLGTKNVKTTSSYDENASKLGRSKGRAHHLGNSLEKSAPRALPEVSQA